MAALHDGLPLPGGWVVRRFVVGQHLRLERDAGLLKREVLRRAGVLLVPVVLAAALGGATWDVDVTVKFIAWPVLALLLLVVVLGALAVVRAARRAGQGVFLEVDAAARTASGWVQGRGLLSDLLAPPARLGVEEVQGVELATFSGGRPGEAAFLSVSLVLGAGRLEGPECRVDAGQVPTFAPTLQAVADALSTLAGVPVTQR